VTPWWNSNRQSLIRYIW